MRAVRGDRPEDPHRDHGPGSLRRGGGAARPGPSERRADTSYRGAVGQGHRDLHAALARPPVRGAHAGRRRRNWRVTRAAVRGLPRSRPAGIAAPAGPGGRLMELLSRAVGPLATNVHVLADPASREAIAIDTAAPSLAWIAGELAERDWTLKLIVST